MNDLSKFGFPLDSKLKDSIQMKLLGVIQKFAKNTKY